MTTRKVLLLLGVWAVIGVAAFGFGQEGLAGPKADAPCQYKSLFIGQAIEGSWSPGDCSTGAPDNRIYDYFLISGAVGQAVTATLNYSNPALNPVTLALKSLDGRVLAYSSGPSPVSTSFILPASGYYLISMGSLTANGYGDYTLSLIATGTCLSGACLNDGRFRVLSTWRKLDGTTGSGTASLFTNDTGYFWFFDSSNVELVVKVLDARVINGFFWVFASGLTNVGVEITVLDTVTGSVKTYQNPVGTAFQPIQDTQAFNGQPAPQNANVGGTWDLTVANPDGSQGGGTFVLVQTGTSVTGTLNGDGIGDVSGTVLGQSFNFTVTQGGPCPSIFAAVAIVDTTGNHMSGTFSGSDCSGAGTGTFTATRR